MNDIDYIKIGLNIKKYRKIKKITQQQLANITGRTERQIRRYEKGLVEIPNSTLTKISNALNVPILDLLDIDKPQQDNKFNYWRNICEIQAEQTAKGLLKYGYPLEQNTWLDINERLRYLQEELVDALMYIEHIKTLLNEGEK